MDRASFEVALRGFINRTPFRPFVVELVSGARLLMHHPEALVVRNNIAIHFSPDGEWNVFDHEGVSQLTSETEQAASA